MQDFRREHHAIAGIAIPSSSGQPWALVVALEWKRPEKRKDPSVQALLSLVQDKSDMASDC
jgi:hypothetical protein